MFWIVFIIEEIILGDEEIINQSAHHVQAKSAKSLVYWHDVVLTSLGAVSRSSFFAQVSFSMLSVVVYR